MQFHENLTLLCPSDQSFQDHLKIWSELETISKNSGCYFTWKVLSKEDKTFIIEVKGDSKQDHLNGLIAVMSFLHEQNIEPAIVADLKNLKQSDSKTAKVSLKGMREALTC